MAERKEKKSKEQKPCPFCNIGQEKNRILKEGRHVIVILSNPRLMPGHTLVIPRRHVSTLGQLKPAERKELFDTAIAFQEKLIQVMGKGSGCDWSQHDRPFMPTTQLTIPGHLHIHLRPRKWKDRFYRKVSIHETPLFKRPRRIERERYQKLLAE